MNMAMTATILTIAGAAAHAHWPDGIESGLRWCAPLPLDWVEGTDITLNMMCVQGGTLGSPTIVLKSSIQAKSAGENADWNIEDEASCNQVLPQGLHTLITRTISGADLAKGEVIDWSLIRSGDDAVDTVNAKVACKMSAWIEYTAV